MRPTPPVLPQDDPDPLGRRTALERERRAHNWDHHYIPGMSMLREAGTNHPSLFGAVLGVLSSSVLPRDDRPEWDYVIQRYFSQYRVGKNGRQIAPVLRREAFDSTRDFDYLYVALDRPRCVDLWERDDFFAFQRLGGMNPVALRRVDEVPAKLALDATQVASLLPKGATLAGLGAEGRLYACDYEVVENVDEIGDVLDRFTPAPVALFFVDDAGDLQPLAIGLTQERSAAATFTPNDDRRLWTIAKTYLQIADMNHHEMVTHLCRTHFVIEAFATAAARSLSSRHPISALLRPHFRMLIFNNFEGRELLLGPKGFASQIMAGGNAGSAELVRRGYVGYEGVPGWTFDDWDLPKELAARGVGDAARLPRYPYRDDGLLLWEALERYVRQYVACCYAGDEEVAADPEVQAWHRELSSERLGNLPGIPPIRDRAGLTTVLTRIIFTCGPQHSAVNFSQYDFAAYPPNMAAAAYARPPLDLRSLSPAELDALLLRILPPPAKTGVQLRTIAELTCFRFDRLGYFQPGDFVDDTAAKLVGFLQGGLEHATHTIALRNLERTYAYPWMRPDGITNSTSV